MMKADIEHIFLITIDCGRQDYFYTSKTQTPSLDGLAEKAITFTNAFSQINNTIPSHVSIFSSRYPSDHGVNSNFEKPFPGSLSLPAVLERNGWKTLSFTGVGFLSWLMGDWCSYNHRISWIPALENPDKRGYGLRKLGIVKGRRSASKTIRQIISRLKMGQRKEFYWLHFFDAHIPHKPTKRILRKYYKDEKYNDLSALEEAEKLGLFVSPGTLQELSPRVSLAYYLAAYTAAIEYIDSEIGRLVQFLKKRSIWEKCLFIVTSDHGENLTENGVFCDHSKLFDETTRVPLYWWDSQIMKGRKIPALVQHVDIYPSILDRLGIEVPDEIRGRSLYTLMSSAKTRVHDFVFAEHARACQYTIRTEDWQYIWQPPDQDHPFGLMLEDNFLIDRKHPKKEDGYENQARQYPEICQEMRTMGERIIETPLTDDMESETVSDEVAKVLKGLGYL
jgi:arylsulfatase